jgi:hypothetical protein
MPHEDKIPPPPPTHTHTCTKHARTPRAFQGARSPSRLRRTSAPPAMPCVPLHRLARAAIFRPRLRRRSSKRPHMVSGLRRRRVGVTRALMDSFAEEARIAFHEAVGTGVKPIRPVPAQMWASPGADMAESRDIQSLVSTITMRSIQQETYSRQDATGTPRNLLSIHHNSDEPDESCASPRGKGDHMSNCTCRAACIVDVSFSANARISSAWPCAPVPQRVERRGALFCASAQGLALSSGTHLRSGLQCGGNGARPR